MKVYLAGPMTGLPEFNYPAFADAAAWLRAKGYNVISPHEVSPETDGHPWGWFLRRDIVALMDADGVAVLPGWASSRGASLEVYVAKALDMPVLSLETWLSLEAPA